MALLPIVGTLATALRIPMFAAFLGGLFSSLIEWFAKFFTRKVAFQLAVVSAIVAVTGVFAATIYTIYSAIVAVAPVAPGGAGAGRPGELFRHAAAARFPLARLRSQDVTLIADGLVLPPVVGGRVCV